MKAFISWSGGKDCLYALYRFLQKGDNSVYALLNMTNKDSDLSRSHGIHNDLVRRQAEALDIPIIQQPAGSKEYEAMFKKAVESMKAKGVDSGVFGDIYLDSHRQWVERVCDDLGIKPIFPLWGQDTSVLIREFIADGFKTITVAVRKEKLPIVFLGKIIDQHFIDDLNKIPEIDLCAERGEYHTFVFDGPIFVKPVAFGIGSQREDDKHYYINLL